MDKQANGVTDPHPGVAYDEPELVVHGEVHDLTAGGAGRTPDAGATGSFLPDDSTFG